MQGQAVGTHLGQVLNYFFNREFAASCCAERVGSIPTDSPEAECEFVIRGWGESHDLGPFGFVVRADNLTPRNV